MKKSCGIHIFKDKTIKYMYSSVCSAVIRLLGYDDLFFNDIESLLLSDHNRIYNKICKHCMMGSSKPILVKNNINFLDIFANSIKKLKS